MREHLSVVTRKGQITVPAEIRRKLGLKRGDTVAFRMADDEVVLRRGENVAEATRGIFNKYVDRPRTAEELRALAEEAIAEDTLERSR